MADYRLLLVYCRHLLYGEFKQKIQQQKIYQPSQSHPYTGSGTLRTEHSLTRFLVMPLQKNPWAPPKNANTTLTMMPIFSYFLSVCTVQLKTKVINATKPTLSCNMSGSLLTMNIIFCLYSYDHYFFNFTPFFQCSQRLWIILATSVSFTLTGQFRNGCMFATTIAAVKLGWHIFTFDIFVI